MALTITLDELLAWSDEERAKWQPWLAANPRALDVVVQPGGRFPTVGALIDHIFLVEQRHTQRLQNQPPPSDSGVAIGDVAALFSYGNRGRRLLREVAAALDPADALSPREFVVPTRRFSVSPRKLLFHIALHEVRHWAQIAAVVRAAGFAPPGDHDLIFSDAFV
jgi:uncharacterized damage-inducible protein DinB